MADDPSPSPSSRRELPRPRYKVLIDALEAQCTQWETEAEATRNHGHHQQRKGLNGSHLIDEAKIRLADATRIRAILARFKKIFGADDE